MARCLTGVILILIGSVSVGHAQPLVIAGDRAFGSRLTVDHNGRLHIAWHNDAEPCHPLYAISNDFGETFSSPRALPSNLCTVDGIATGSDELVYIVGRGPGPQGGDDVHIAISTNGGASFSTQNLSQSDVNESEIALAAHGRSVYVLWGGPFSVALMTRSRDAGAHFEQPKEIFTGLNFGFGRVGSPPSRVGLAAGPSGTIVASTVAEKGSLPMQIWVARSLDGGDTFDNSVVIQGSDHPWVSSTPITVTSSDGILVTWVADSLKYAASLPGTVSFGQVTVLAESVAGDGHSPVIASDSRGNVRVVWSHYPAIGLGIASSYEDGFVVDDLYSEQSHQWSLDPWIAVAPNDVAWVTWSEGTLTAKQVLLLSQATVPTHRTYVASGDSVAAGQDIERQSTNRCRAYPELVRVALGMAGSCMEEGGYNIAVPGATTADYELNQLNSVIEESPDVITITVGANDIMQPPVDCIETAWGRHGSFLLPAILFGGFPGWSFLMDLDIRLCLHVVFRNFQRLLDGLATGVERIYRKLVTETAAPILVTDYFNPVSANGSSSGLTEMFGHHTAALNSIIAAETDKNPSRTHLVRVSEAFDNHHGVGAGCSYIAPLASLAGFPRWLQFLQFGVHPNEQGQQVIASTIVTKLRAIGHTLARSSSRPFIACVERLSPSYVLLHGAGFETGARVLIDGISSSIVVGNESHLIAHSPTSANGIEVKVINVDGQTYSTLMP